MPTLTSANHPKIGKHGSPTGRVCLQVRSQSGRDAEAIQFLIHQNAFVLIGMSYNLYREPSFTHVAQLCILMGVYLHAVSCEKMNLNAKNLRFLYVLFYSAFSLFIIASVWQKDRFPAAAVLVCVPGRGCPRRNMCPNK